MKTTYKKQYSAQWHVLLLGLCMGMTSGIIFSMQDDMIDFDIQPVISFSSSEEMEGAKKLAMQDLNEIVTAASMLLALRHPRSPQPILDLMPRKGRPERAQKVISKDGSAEHYYGCDLCPNTYVKNYTNHTKTQKHKDAVFAAKRKEQANDPYYR